MFYTHAQAANFRNFTRAAEKFFWAELRYRLQDGSMEAYRAALLPAVEAGKVVLSDAKAMEILRAEYPAMIRFLDRVKLGMNSVQKGPGPFDWVRVFQKSDVPLGLGRNSTPAAAATGATLR